MTFKETDFWQWWREYGKHIEALLIIVLLVVVWFSYTNNSKLQEKISHTCGWAEDDYECFCQKSDVIALKNKVIGDLSGILNTNFTVGDK